MVASGPMAVPPISRRGLRLKVLGLVASPRRRCAGTDASQQRDLSEREPQAQAALADVSAARRGGCIPAHTLRIHHDPSAHRFKQARRTRCNKDTGRRMAGRVSRPPGGTIGERIAAKGLRQNGGRVRLSPKKAFAGTEPEITTQGNTIIVQIPGVKDKDRALELVRPDRRPAVPAGARRCRDHRVRRMDTRPTRTPTDSTDTTGSTDSTDTTAPDASNSSDSSTSSSELGLGLS